MNEDFITEQKKMYEKETFTGTDTLTLNYLFGDRSDRVKVAIAIKNKLRVENEEEHTYIGRYGKYTFYFTAEWYSLNVTLQHELVAGRTEKEIEHEATAVIKEYFGIDDVKLKNLNRMDYKIDYKLKTEEEKEIIKNINEKAVDTRYSYTKQITTQDGFYDAKFTKRNNKYVEIVIYDKEEEWKKYCKKKRNRK